jgi:hypothetical protein
MQEFFVTFNYHSCKYFMPAYIIIILISFIASLLGLTVPANRAKLKFFPVLLLITFIIELIGSNMSSSNKHNVVLYNFLSIFEIGFYLFFLNSVIKPFSKRKIIPYLIFIYLILALVNIFFIQGIDKFHTYSYIFGCLFIAALCIIYFNFLFRFTKSPALIREPEFWIVTGILFFHAFSLPVVGIINFIANIPLRLQILLSEVISFMNIMIYLLFTIGFLCRINIRKLSR